MTYHFYSSVNAENPVIVKFNSTNQLNNKTFNGLRNTIILIHGWGDSAKGLLVKTVKNAILSGRYDYNIIGLDWSPVWKNSTVEVFKATLAKEIGKCVASFLNTLQKDFKLHLSNLTLAGHSAGGPVCGGIGSAIKGIKHIVGLDTNSISKTDADFVQVSRKFLYVM